jgi:hypothetical protein
MLPGTQNTRDVNVSVKLLKPTTSWASDGHLRAYVVSGRDQRVTAEEVQ